jgi:hypothetical protein
VDARGIAQEPIPAEPVRPNSVPDPRVIGAVRLPIAGPYRPWARLVRDPDGRLVWIVRLWEGDRAVARAVETATLRGFAERSGLPDLARRIDAIVAHAEPGSGP